MERFNIARAALIVGISLVGLLGFAQQSLIEGNLTYHDDWALSGASVYLVDSTGNRLDTIVTDTTGHYLFTGLYSGAHTLEMSVQAAQGGVEPADAVLVLHYLLPNGQVSLSPIQLLAADMNEDGSVTFADVLSIILYWAKQNNGNSKSSGGGSTSSSEGDWVFVTTDVSDTTVTDTTSYDSEGSKRGDVDGAFEPQKKPSATVYVQSEGKVEIMRGGAVSVPFIADGARWLNGFAIRIGYDPARFGITNINCALEGASTIIYSDHFVISWLSPDGSSRAFAAGEEIFTVVGDLKQNAAAGEMEFRSLVNSQVFEGTLVPSTSSFLLAPKINIYDDMAVVSQAYPNPSSGATNVEIHLLENCVLSYSITDSKGSCVYSTSLGHFNTGEHNIPLNINTLSKGSYIISFLFENETQRFKKEQQLLRVD